MGRSMTLQEAITYALVEGTPEPPDLPGRKSEILPPPTSGRKWHVVDGVTRLTLRVLRG